MKKIPAQDICDILNSMMSIDGFKEALRSRVKVTGDVAHDSDVNCSPCDNGYNSSPLGLIQALSDEVIVLTCTESHDLDFDKAYPMSVAINNYNSDYDKYLLLLNEYNSKHGTDHKPEKRKEFS